MAAAQSCVRRRPEEHGSYEATRRSEAQRETEGRSVGLALASGLFESMWSAAWASFSLAMRSALVECVANRRHQLVVDVLDQQLGLFLDARRGVAQQVVEPLPGRLEGTAGVLVLFVHSMPPWE